MTDYKKLAQEYQLSVDAIQTLAQALAAGEGKMAQFNHPELGGMGQWMPGMVMIGDAFNHNLKNKVTQICHVLTEQYNAGTIDKGLDQPTNWWPDKFGTPTSTGTQNAVHYAMFANQKRLIIKRGNKQTIYDTGSHIITGVSQQQQDNSQRLVFHSQHRLLTEADLKVIESEDSRNKL